MRHIENMIKQKKKFVISITIFSTAFYLMLPLSIVFFPHVMATPIWHYFNLGWVLAFAQFVMTWGIGLLYLYKARQFDQHIDEWFDHKE